MDPRLVAKSLVVHAGPAFGHIIPSHTYIPLNPEATGSSMNQQLLLSFQCPSAYPNTILLQALAKGHPFHKPHQDDTLCYVFAGSGMGMGNSPGQAPLTCPQINNLTVIPALVIEAQMRACQ